MLSTVPVFFQKLREKSFDFVCFSATTLYQYNKMIPFARIAKDTGHKTLLGGCWCRLDNPVDEDVFGAVCRGDGESLPDFLLNWDTRLFKAPMIHRDLNTLPIPDYELFKDIPFVRGLPFLDGKKTLPYISSRGCPFKCAFCEVRKLTFPRARTKVERDLRELSDRYKPDIFYIGDAQLPYWSKRWRSSWGNFRFPFVGAIRADIEPDMLLWMIDRGLKGTLFGIEAGDEKYRNRVLKKGITDDQIWRTIGVLEKYSVSFIATFMFDIPGEKFIHKTVTAEMAEKIGTARSIYFHYEDRIPWRP
jgi:radical SAM superfamily enzyme YgiQ (UPF0313 family)